LVSGTNFYLVENAGGRGRKLVSGTHFFGRDGFGATGDVAICLAAGDIARWAAGLADGIACARAAK
jgi:hypothetical protein